MAPVALSADGIECDSPGFKRSTKLALPERRANARLRRYKRMRAGAWQQMVGNSWADTCEQFGYGGIPGYVYCHSSYRPVHRGAAPAPGLGCAIDIRRFRCRDGNMVHHCTKMAHWGILSLLPYCARQRCTDGRHHHLAGSEIQPLFAYHKTYN